MVHKPSALVLLSGGIDSTTLLYYVKKKLLYTKIKTIGFDYGQTHKKELLYAKKIAEELNISFEIFSLNLTQFGDFPLIGNKNVPNTNEDKQYLTFVPGRNAIFLSFAVAYAYIKEIDDIFFAPVIDDFKSYPDCRSGFINNFNQAMSLGYGKKIYAPFVNLFKKEIVVIGNSLKVPYDKTWSCYKGGKIQCGKCDACIERQNALNINIYE